MDVASLLRSKCRCLEKFLDLSNDFLRESAQGDLSSLPRFQQDREKILKAVALYDRKIDEESPRLAKIPKSPALIEEVKALLAKKDELVREILRLDLIIIQKIEHEKDRLLKELAAFRKEKEITGKFKSRWIAEPGDELDRKL